MLRHSETPSRQERISDSPHPPAICACAGTGVVPVLEQALGVFKTKDSRPEIHIVSSGAEAAQVLQFEPALVIVLCLTSKQDVLGAFTLLDRNGGRIRDGSARVIVINSIHHPKLPLRLKDKGCAEVLAHTVSVRALIHKIDQSCAFLERNRTKTTECKRNASDAMTSKHDCSVIWTAPLDLRSDVWLIDRESGVRNVLGRWLIEAVGPGPSCGTWESRDSQKWKWVPRRTETKRFIVDPGEWVFSGRQPEFAWKENVWRFVSNEPCLSFEKANGESVSRFRFSDASTFFISGNSNHALSRKAEIEATFQSSIVLTGGVESPKRQWNRHEDEEVRLSVWNDLSREGENKGIEWLGTDLGRENTFNTEQGIGLGQASDREGYDHEDWNSAIDAAFERVEVKLLLQPENREAILLEIAGTGLVFSTSNEAPGKAISQGQHIRLRAVLSAGVREHTFDMPVIATEIEDSGSGDLVVHATLIGEKELISEFRRLQSVFAKRQKSILKFLGEAKGY